MSEAVLAVKIQLAERRAEEIERLFTELIESLEEIDRLLADLLAPEAGAVPEIVHEEPFYVNYAEIKYYLALREGRLAVVIETPDGGHVMRFSEWLKEFEMEEEMAYVGAGEALPDFLRKAVGVLGEHEDPRVRRAAQRLGYVIPTAMRGGEGPS